MFPSPNVENVRQSFKASSKELGEVLRVDQLAGDGSTRSYYRVVGGNGNLVLQTNGADDLGFRRFVAAHEFYVKVGIPVPRLIAYDDKTLWILLEDLGSEDLQALASFDNLEQSVQLLPHLASKNISEEFSKIWLSERSLNQERFTFEMEYFCEHFVNKLLGEQCDPQLKTELLELSKLASQSPYVFCHRDYQSRNLMRHSKHGFVMIDFQDSQWGPLLYDAVSICWDPYYVLSDLDRSRLFDSYLSTLKKQNVSKEVELFLSNPKNIEESKNLLIAERFIKAVGSFASFKTIRGKDTHLVYIQDSFKVVLNSLNSLKDLGHNFPLLLKNVQRWVELSSENRWRRGS